ncbi:MAG: glyceraldehyde-3-phosphate dehydrogenase [Burkholderiales bacterium]
MRQHAFRGVLAALLLAQCALAPAQTAIPLRDAEVVADADARTRDTRSGRARFFDPADGQLDLSYFLENPRGFLPVPIVITEPAVGYGGGGLGMFLRPRREAGDEGWARPDISAIGGAATQNGTWGAFAGDASRWLDGRLRTLVGAGTGRVNLDFYGLGDASSLNRALSYSLQFRGAIAQANWQLAAKSPWAAGVRYVYADVDPALRDDPVFPQLARRARVKISAPTAILEYDSRDSVFTPTRGIYAESSWMASRESLGATADFERFEQVLIGWVPAAERVTLGARGLYAWSSDGTPFFLRPFVQLRGVPAMRYQGDQAASLEVEARWQVYGRWSVVGFGGAGTTRTDGPFFTATQNVGSGGAGFRYEIASRFGLHVGIDVAHSPGTNAFYFVVGNAWFRP